MTWFISGGRRHASQVPQTTLTCNGLIDTIRRLRRILPEQVGVVLPVAFDFRHDALKFGVTPELVPALIALKPGVIVVARRTACRKHASALPFSPNCT